MSKIAILSCIDSAIKCSSIDCLGFFENRERSFSMYGDSQVIMAASMVCDCCKHEDGLDSFLKTKIERMKNQGITDVHVADCVTSEKKNCQYAKKILDALRDYGLDVYFIKPSSRTDKM